MRSWIHGCFLINCSVQWSLMTKNSPLCLLLRSSNQACNLAVTYPLSVNALGSWNSSALCLIFQVFPHLFIQIISLSFMHGLQLLPCSIPAVHQCRWCNFGCIPIGWTPPWHTERQQGVCMMHMVLYLLDKSTRHTQLGSYFLPPHQHPQLLPRLASSDMMQCFSSLVHSEPYNIWCCPWQAPEYS